MAERERSKLERRRRENNKRGKKPPKNKEIKERGGKKKELSWHGQFGVFRYFFFMGRVSSDGVNIT